MKRIYTEKQKIEARDKYRKSHPHSRIYLTGLTYDQKLERKRKLYLETSHPTRRNKKPSTMEPDELIQHQKEQIKKYNKKQAAKKRSNYIPKRISLSHLTDEEKKERYRIKAKERYRKQRKEKGFAVRNYGRLTDEEKKERYEDRKLKARLSYVKKPRKKKERPPKRGPYKVGPSKRYIQNIELTYEVILSKGKGSTTEKLKHMIYEICVGVNKRFNYYDEDIRYDVMMETYLYSIQNYMGYDHIKFNNAFSYITEIIKRAHASNFKYQLKRGLKMADTQFNIKFISSSDKEYII